MWILNGGKMHWSVRGRCVMWPKHQWEVWWNRPVLKYPYTWSVYTGSTVAGSDFIFKPLSCKIVLLVLVTSFVKFSHIYRNQPPLGKGKMGLFLHTWVLWRILEDHLSLWTSTGMSVGGVSCFYVTFYWETWIVSIFTENIKWTEKSNSDTFTSPDFG